MQETGEQDEEDIALEANATVERRRSASIKIAGG